MECKQCGKEYEAKRATAKYCSVTCKQASYRNKGVTVTSESVTVTASLEHYQANPEMYATRSYPDELNWGKWMDAQALSAAKLRANRVTLPGDWDYTSYGFADRGHCKPESAGASTSPVSSQTQPQAAKGSSDE